MNKQKIKPLKRFGQNYLYDKNILNKIINEFNPKPKENIIEIGPGRGALTEILCEKAGNLTAIEIDSRVIEKLKSLSQNINIVNDDFLDLDLTSFQLDIKKKIRIIGNIPYNITSPIIFKLIDSHKLISDAVFMVQHEVAKRMTGAMGTKDYGIFSVILNYFCDVKYCFKVSRNVFKPRPNVDSAVVHLIFKEKLDNELLQKTFVEVVKASFGNRRKILKNSLSNSIFKNFDFNNCGIDVSKRAEEFEIKDFIHLAKFILKNPQFKN